MIINHVCTTCLIYSRNIYLMLFSSHVISSRKPYRMSPQPRSDYPCVLVVHWARYLLPSQLLSSFTIIISFFFHSSFWAPKGSTYIFVWVYVSNRWHGANICHCWLATNCGFLVSWNMAVSDSSCHQNTGPKLSGLKHKTFLCSHTSVACLRARVWLRGASGWV